MKINFWKRGIAPLIPLLIIGGLAAVTIVGSLFTQNKNQTTSSRASQQTRYRCHMVSYDRNDCTGNIINEVDACSLKDKTGECSPQGGPGAIGIKYESCTRDDSCGLSPTPSATSAPIFPPDQCSTNSDPDCINHSVGDSCGTYPPSGITRCKRSGPGINAVGVKCSCLPDSTTPTPTTSPNTCTGICYNGISCAAALQNGVTASGSCPIRSGKDWQVCCKPGPTLTPTLTPTPINNACFSAGGECRVGGCDLSKEHSQGPCKKAGGGPGPGGTCCVPGGVTPTPTTSPNTCTGTCHGGISCAAALPNGVTASGSCPIRSGKDWQVCCKPGPTLTPTPKTSCGSGSCTPSYNCAPANTDGTCSLANGGPGVCCYGSTPTPVSTGGPLTPTPRSTCHTPCAGDNECSSCSGGKNQCIGNLCVNGPGLSPTPTTTISTQCKCIGGKYNDKCGDLSGKPCPTAGPNCPATCTVNAHCSGSTRCGTGWTCDRAASECIPPQATPTKKPAPTSINSPTPKKTYCQYPSSCTNSDQCTGTNADGTACDKLECNTTIGTAGYSTCMRLGNPPCLGRSLCEGANKCVTANRNTKPKCGGNPDAKDPATGQPYGDCCDDNCFDGNDCKIDTTPSSCTVQGPAVVEIPSNTKDDRPGNSADYTVAKTIGSSPVRCDKPVFSGACKENPYYPFSQGECFDNNKSCSGNVKFYAGQGSTCKINVSCEGNTITCSKTVTIKKVNPTSTPKPTKRPTKTPTAVPTGIPPVATATLPPGMSPTVTPPPGTTEVPSGVCVPTNGDADGQGGATIVDFAIWRDEFLRIQTTKFADFNCDGTVDLVDFAIWRDGFLNN